MDRAGDAQRRRRDDHRGRDDRQRRGPVDHPGAQARLHPGRVDQHDLRPGLRRAADHAGAAGRRLRAAADALPRRPRPVHRRLGPGRARADRRHPDPRPRAPGRRRRDDPAGDAGDPELELPGPRPGDRVRHLGLRDRRRRGRRAAPRRLPHDRTRRGAGRSSSTCRSGCSRSRARSTTSASRATSTRSRASTSRASCSSPAAWARSCSA